jgi:hypothetical protein
MSRTFVKSSDGQLDSGRSVRIVQGRHSISSKKGVAGMRGCLLFAILMLLCHLSVGQAVQIQRAKSFLDNDQNASSILSFIHLYADYHGHEFLGETGVKDSSGNSVPGEVALIYRYHWEDDGVTEIGFFVNQSGTIVGTWLGKDNGVFSQPFALANLSIQVVGRMVINSDDKMSATDRELAVKLVDNADARGLLNLWLRMQ